MIAGTTGGLRHNVEAQLREVEGIDEGIDHTHRIVGANRLVEPFGKECRLIAIPPSINRVMPAPACSCGSYHASLAHRSQIGVFTRPRIVRLSIWSENAYAD